MRRILVTGANGQLGNAMRLLGATSRNEYRFTDVAELDITDEEAVRRAVCDGRIDVIVNCAAYTNVDRAEEDEATADRINRLAVGNLARAAAGEAEVEQSGCKSLIIRTAWLYSEFGHNFLKTMLRLTAERDRLTVVFDQAGTPTYAGDLARTIFDIVESGAYAGREGIYHFSNEGVCSWYDFAHAIAAEAGHTQCTIEPCHSSEYPSKVERPAYSVLDKSKIKATFGVKIPHWTESLKVCMKNLKNL